MREGSLTTLAALGVVAVLLAPGCVTKKTFKSNVAETDARISAVETAVEDGERRVADLTDETSRKLAVIDGKTADAMQLGNQAKTTAERAQEAAKGKLLWTVTLSNDQIKFPFGKATLTGDAASALDNLVEGVKSYSKALYIEIEGHTDGTGPAGVNEKLGEERAQAVRDYLHGRGGLPLHAMSTISYGSSKPVADNTTQAGRAQNRRVVVRVLE
jgi:outer membrane protein OmpA-like peptidoglycan-associated protein